MAIRKFDSTRELFQALVPEFKFVQYTPLMVQFGWEPKWAEAVAAISPKRAMKRYMGYVDEAELERASAILVKGKDSASIRFGVKKTGHGINGDRGDFCLVGGVYQAKKKTLVLFYRSIELIGGLHYDLTLMNSVIQFMDIPVKQVQIWALQGHTMALKGNSNERLFKQLTEIYK